MRHGAKRGDVGEPSAQGRRANVIRREDVAEKGRCGVGEPSAQGRRANVMWRDIAEKGRCGVGEPSVTE